MFKSKALDLLWETYEYYQKLSKKYAEQGNKELEELNDSIANKYLNMYREIGSTINKE